MRRALPGDIATLVALMAEFYAESDYGLDQELAEKAFAAILSDERLGYVWLIDDEAKVVGYVVLTLRFGMEYGGCATLGLGSRPRAFAHVGRNRNAMARTLVDPEAYLSLDPDAASTALTRRPCGTGLLVR